MDRLPKISKQAAKRLARRSDLLLKNSESKAISRAGVEGSLLVAAFKREVEAETEAFRLGAEIEAKAFSDAQVRLKAARQSLSAIAGEIQDREERTRRAVSAETEAAAHLLEVPDQLRTSDSYSEFHQSDEPLRLGPDSTSRSSAGNGTKNEPQIHALAQFSKRVETPPLSPADTEQLLQATRDPNAISVIEHCGAIVEGQAVIRTVNGNTVKWTGRGLKESQLDGAGVADTCHLVATRAESNPPPYLRPAALAAFAIATACRSEQTLAERKTFLAALVCGVPSEIESDLISGAIAPESAVSILGNAIDWRKGGTAAAALAEIAYELTRVRVVKSEDVPAATAPHSTPAIDLGRVRWCQSSNTLAWHLPMTAADPDQVGGPDLAWTTDPPTPAATRSAHHQRLSLATDWHSRLVVVPGSPRLWIVTPNGEWWNPEIDYDTVVKARLAHLGEWWAAQSKLNEIAPRAIKAIERVERTKPEPEPRRKEDVKSPKRDSKKSKHRREFRGLDREGVQKAAGRYSYRDDSGPVRAGSKAAKRGNYTREELLEVTGWKSNRTQALVEKNSEAAIERATAIALDPDKSEKERIEALNELSGVGYPVASAILHFADPDRYPIIDFRALESLGMKDPEGRYTTEFWLNYLDTTRKGSEILGVSMRVLDKALWQLSKESGD